MCLMGKIWYQRGNISLVFVGGLNGNILYENIDHLCALVNERKFVTNTCIQPVIIDLF